MILTCKDKEEKKWEGVESYVWRDDSLSIVARTKIIIAPLWYSMGRYDSWRQRSNNN